MLNTAIIMGRLTADPELCTTQTGLSVTSFTVAVDRNYKSGDERQTDFINVITRTKTAINAQQLKLLQIMFLFVAAKVKTIHQHLISRMEVFLSCPTLTMDFPLVQMTMRDFLFKRFSDG